MIVRKAKLKDVPGIVEIWEEFMRTHDEEIVVKNPDARSHIKLKDDAPKKFRLWVSKQIKSRNGIVFVAEDNCKLIGYSMNYIKPNIPVFSIEKLGHFSDLYVKKEYRKKGIATKFRDMAQEWFMKKKVGYVSIFVHNENELAHSIYRKWGFFDYHIEMRKKV